MNKLILFYKQYWLIRWLWWLSVMIPIISFMLVSLALIIFMHWPRDYKGVGDFSFNPSVEYVSISAHGLKDSPNSWGKKLQSAFIEGRHITLDNKVSEQHVSLDWRPYSDNAFLCSVAGKKIGHELGKELSTLSQLKRLHLIGHSCGAFVVLGLCETIKKLKPSVNVQSTYLDPVSVYSGILWDYGINHFGRCANVSDAYIDTHDTVPGSNQALPYAYTFDVTQQRLEQSINYTPHTWPTFFYINAVKKKQVPIHKERVPAFKLHQYSKGELIIWPVDN